MKDAIKKCGFVYHISGKGTSPCANHASFTECRGIPLTCKETTLCGVCGYCQKDCVGHLGLHKSHVAFGILAVPVEV